MAENVWINRIANCLSFHMMINLGIAYGRIQVCFIWEYTAWFYESISHTMSVRVSHYEGQILHKGYIKHAHKHIETNYSSLSCGSRPHLHSSKFEVFYCCWMFSMLKTNVYSMLKTSMYICIYTYCKSLNMAWTLYTITVLPWTVWSKYSGWRAPLFIFTHWLAWSVHNTGHRPLFTYHEIAVSRLTLAPARLRRHDLQTHQWLMAQCSIHVSPHD